MAGLFNITWISELSGGPGGFWKIYENAENETRPVRPVVNAEFTGEFCRLAEMEAS